MSGVTAASILPTVLGGIATAAVGSLLAPKAPGVQAPTAPPASQAAQAPNTQNVRNAVSGTGQAGGQPGAASTFLTGAQGVDPSQLALNKNTLLGGGTSLLGG